jgi:hypothetical protein
VASTGYAYGEEAYLEAVAKPRNEVSGMLWYCRFEWLPGTSAEQVRRKVVAQHDAGVQRPEQIRGWYNLAGGGAGFLLVEADDPRDLTQLLQPYMDLIKWNVHAIYELNYEATIEAFRNQIQAAS